jgi:hypothetical protein
MVNLSVLDSRHSGIWGHGEGVGCRTANFGGGGDKRVGGGHHFLGKRVGGGGYNFFQLERKLILPFRAFLGTFGSKTTPKCLKNLDF